MKTFHSEVNMSTHSELKADVISELLKLDAAVKAKYGSPGASSYMAGCLYSVLVGTAQDLNCKQLERLHDWLALITQRQAEA